MLRELLVPMNFCLHGNIIFYITCVDFEKRPCGWETKVAWCVYVPYPSVRMRRRVMFHTCLVCLSVTTPAPTSLISTLKIRYVGVYLRLFSLLMCGISINPSVQKLRREKANIQISEGSDTGGNHVHLHRNQLEIRVRNQKSNSLARNQKSDTILG